MSSYGFGFLALDCNGNRREGAKDVDSSLGWLWLGASLIGTVTSFSSFRNSSGWIAPAVYGTALGLNLLTGLGVLVVAGQVGKSAAAIN